MFTKEEEQWAIEQVGKYVRMYGTENAGRIGKIISYAGTLVGYEGFYLAFNVVWAYGIEELIYKDYQIMESENELG